MATIKLMLNNTRELADGTHTLILQIIHNRRRSVISTPYRLSLKEFDAKHHTVLPLGRTKAARTRVLEINKYISVQIRELWSIIRGMEASGTSFTASDISAAYRRRGDFRYVRVFVEQLCTEFEQQKRHGTAANYRSMLSVFEKFMGDKECRFDRFDELLLTEFEGYLRNIPLKRNTITFHMRTLRSVHNKACKRGLIPKKESNMFDDVSFRIEKTRKLAVSIETIRRVAEADFPEMPWLAESRDLFMFSYYTRGMSFVDMAYLTRDNIRDGTIYYTRHKTRQVFTVRIVAALQTIIDRYAHCTPWVLPVMKHSTLKITSVEESSGMEPDMPAQLLYRRYKHALADYWYHLGKISKMLNTGKRLTFNVARHSWASLAQERGIPLAVISGGLGHTSEKTTAIYLDEIDARKIDEANEMLSKL